MMDNVEFKRPCKSDVINDIFDYWMLYVNNEKIHKSWIAITTSYWNHEKVEEIYYYGKCIHRVRNKLNDLNVLKYILSEHHYKQISKPLKPGRLF